MAKLIDSSVFIDLERRRRPLGDLIRLSQSSGEPMALASITVSELLVGVHRADTPERRSSRRSFVDKIISQIPVLPLDFRVAEKHAEIWGSLLSGGQPIGAHDLIIAATALAYDYSVLTHNLRDFRRVPGLVVEQPEW